LTAGFLTSVVGYVPPTAFEVKAVERHQFLKPSIAVRAVFQGRVGKPLQRFGYLMTPLAFVFVNRHPYSPPVHTVNQTCVSFHELFLYNHISLFVKGQQQVLSFVIDHG
jgi:hypothetical protein